MQMTRTSRAISISAAALLAISAFSAAPAFADGSGSRGGSLLDAQLVGSMLAPASPQIALINPGGAPWVNGPSRVQVSKKGQVMVDIMGLVIPPPRGTGVNPIAFVVATLVCDEKVVGSTARFALSRAGNGSTSGMISVPRHCDDPVVLIQPAANLGVYIASTLDDDDEGTDS